MQKNYIGIRPLPSLFLILSLTCLTMVHEACAQLTIRGGTFVLRGSNALLSTDRMFVIDSAQLTNEGSIVINDTFALRNAGTFFLNSGTGVLSGDRVAIFDSASTNNLGLVEVSNIFRVKRGSVNDTANFRSTSGTLGFFGTGNKSVRTDLLGLLDLGNLEMATAGFNTTRFWSAVHTDQLTLTNGRIDMENSDGHDSLRVNQGGMIVGGNKRSYADSLYRQPSSSGDNLYFPVGNTGLANQFRPMEMVSTSYSGSEPWIKVKYTDPGIVSYDSLGLGSVDFSNFWVVQDFVDDLDSFFARPTIDTNDIPNSSAAVVAQTRNDGVNIFYSMGRSNITTSGDSMAVEAELRSPDNVIVAIGKATQLNLRIRAFLGGALAGANDTQMDARLMFHIRDTMESRFEQPGYGVPMIPGYGIPLSAADTAVDSIKIYLRTGIQANTTIDSISAWLMTDGSIRDFASGVKDYVTFANARAADGPFYVVVTHRNHLAVMSATAVPLSNTVPVGLDVDFGNPASIYGVGGSGYNMSVSYLWEGNTNYDREVNAADLNAIQTIYGIFDGLTNLQVGYRNEDVDMTDAAVRINTMDYQRVTLGNNWIYFSAVPGI